MLKFSFFHLVQVSPWPILASFCFFDVMLSFILWVSRAGLLTFFLSFFISLLISYLWWRDVERESTFLGCHPVFVKNSLKLGMVLFILSEVMFFVSFFWSFVHSSTVIEVSMGMSWPPFNIQPFNPLGVPLLNTIILLSSGVTVTWSHHLMLIGNKGSSLFSLFFTIFLGVVFSFFQFFEYSSSSFCISDGVVGSTFFMSTGFHGFHVLIGSTFLFVSFVKELSFFNTFLQNVGFECSAWYWHFVDVVWLFLYSLVYWWGY